MLTAISRATASKMISSTIHVWVPLDEDFRAVAAAANVAATGLADADAEPEAAPDPDPAGSAGEVTVGVSGKL
jgi:hypothetical protein